MLYERAIRDARAYVRLAEAENGPIDLPVDPAYVWGDLLDALRWAEPDVHVVNLETSVTSSEEPWPDKGIHYRMDPQNVACLDSGRIDCCSLANNHVMDWGYAGLEETLRTLDRAGIVHAGAGRNGAEAAAPAVLDAKGKGRVLVFAFGHASSGIPQDWEAAEKRPGVRLLEDLSEATAQRIGGEVRSAKRAGDVVVASMHWGGNWGYDIPGQHVRFAHRLVEEGVDLVHGHSSHHPKAVEVFQDALILYGCGDLLNDYEGISGYEAFRDDLSLVFAADVDPQAGRLVGVRVIPMQIRKLRLNRPSKPDVRWLGDLLNRLGGRFGTSVEVENGRSMQLDWG